MQTWLSCTLTRFFLHFYRTKLMSCMWVPSFSDCLYLTTLSLTLFHLTLGTSTSLNPLEFSKHKYLFHVIAPSIIFEYEHFLFLFPQKRLPLSIILSKKFPNLLFLGRNLFPQHVFPLLSFWVTSFLASMLLSCFFVHLPDSLSCIMVPLQTRTMFSIFVTFYWPAYRRCWKYNLYWMSKHKENKHEIAYLS